jgi:hypothetical protein
VFRSLYVFRSGCPVACRLPLVLILVAEPGCCRSFMLEGDMLVGLGCPAERTDAGSNRLFRGRLRSGRLALRRGKPLADGGWARIVLPHRFQLAHPRADSGKTLPYLRSAARPGLRPVVHASSMHAPGSFATHGCRLLHFAPAEVRRAPAGHGLCLALAARRNLHTDCTPPPRLLQTRLRS